ncbi:hypothetical protein LJK88_11660 [Paenibacillus sp. P26]|nr:hypothetical protein LJK88_11660 [Paenibacillus sp. P26]
MKIVTILGTRPEIIRLSLIIKKLDELAEKHILVHTGQNFTHTLSDIFFQELGLRPPDYMLQHRQGSRSARSWPPCSRRSSGFCFRRSRIRCCCSAIRTVRCAPS